VGGLFNLEIIFLAVQKLGCWSFTEEVLADNYWFQRIPFSFTYNCNILDLILIKMPNPGSVDTNTR
jgi:hypothetical protein